MQNGYLKNFFMVEIRNEAAGGTSPSTLGSAYDSWTQAPNRVLKSWTGAKTNEQLATTLKNLKRMLKKYGGNKELEDLVG